MKPGFINILIILLFFTVCIHAQNSSREYLGYKLEDNRLEVLLNDGTYEIKCRSNQAFQVSFIPDSFATKDFSYALKDSSQYDEFKVEDTEEALIAFSKNIKVYIKKAPFNIGFYKDSLFLFADSQGYVKTDLTQKVSFEINSDEMFFGGGARVLGMNRRGYDLQLYNRAHYGYTTHSELMNYTLPMYISSKQYAVMFDNPSSGHLDLDSDNNNVITYEASGGRIKYLVITGDDWYDLTKQITSVTGNQPLPPRWAFGNISSRFGYHSQNEVEKTIDMYFKDSIPVEAAVLDLYWFGKNIKGSMGNLDWYRDSFPNPEQMITNFQNKGVKTILVTEPFVLTTSKRWEEAVQDEVLCTDSLGNPYTYDFYFGNTGLIDVFKPEARQWFWNIYKNLTDSGIGGWWGDLGEPEVHPAALRHNLGTADELHNAYGHEWARLIYEGYKKDFPEQRPFILMRAGFAGSQRYGVIPWSGDVSQSWGGLVGQPEISLQMGMQGLAYMHSDLGGFAVADDKVEVDNELYIRWLQYGVFQPIFRPHAQEKIPSEPVFQNDTTKEYVKHAIDLRYKLLPYNYSLAFDNSQTGKTLMTPLFYIEPDNKELLTYEDAYMWGDAFLVSPVKEPGKKVQDVYLPKGNSWYDFYANKTYEGGQIITTSLVLDHLPVFIKSGSFVPMFSEVKQTKYYSLNSFEMHYYPTEEYTTSSYSLYNDDGKTSDSFEKGMYELIDFNAKEGDGFLSIEINRRKGKNYKSTKNSITFVVHNIKKKPRKVEFNGIKISKKKVEFSNEDSLIKFTVGVDDEKQNIKIRY